ncbi:MAG: Na+/H+ antiporter [Chloroflexi bacterium]|nr:Na+/H+ antiporter [Chloroflexota bacterium]OJV92620.1 MAG: Na+/H+ antiporter [Chloroflexi bacterium 54-19]
MNFAYSLTLQAAETQDNTFEGVTTVLWLLIAVGVVAVLTKYIRLPYTIALVLAGIAIALVPGLPAVTLTPDLIVILFLPALLFEAAYNLSFEQLKESVRFISALAFWGVLATAALVAGLLIWWGGLPWQTALIFGAIIGATDPISVIATFRHLGAPKRLTIIMEGESLFNDGSALVLFNLLLGIVVTQQFSVVSSLFEFVKVAAGGLLLGGAVGYLALFLLRHLNDYLTETLVTLIVAYGTFLAAEQLQVSPALAVVAAGLLVGNFGQEKVMSPTTQVAVGLSWEFIGFLANSLIFLLVGLEIRAIQILNFWEITLLAIGVALFSRVVVIGFFSGVANLLQRRRVIPLSWQTLLIWGGLRGSLSLAMALSLPAFLSNGDVFPGRDQILVMTFGLIMFNLLVQGLTIEPLMRLLKLGQATTAEMRRYEFFRGQMLIAQAVRRRLDELASRNLMTEEMAGLLRDEYAARENLATEELHRIQMNNREMKEAQLQLARRKLLQVEKGTALDLYNQGIISEETLGLLRGEIDAQLTGREHVINPAVKLPPVELSQPPELPEGDKVSPVPEPGQPVQPG